MSRRAVPGGDPRENRGAARANQPAGAEPGASGADQEGLRGVASEDRCRRNTETQFPDADRRRAAVDRRDCRGDRRAFAALPLPPAGAASLPRGIALSAGIGPARAAGARGGRGVGFVARRVAVPASDFGERRAGPHGSRCRKD